MPALYTLAARAAAARRRSPSSASPASRAARRRLPRRDARRLRQVRAPPPPGRRDALAELRARACFYQQGDYEDPDGLRRAEGAARRRSTRRAAFPATASSTSPTPPSTFPVGARATCGAAGLVEHRATERALHPRHHREAVRHRPRERARAQPRRALGARARSQIYRIDHYLGKETVQNLMVFRFANGMFEPLWNNRYVDHVQITGAESHRHRGPRRLLRAGRHPARHGAEPPLPGARLTAMEPPVSMSADDLRDEKLKVLKALRPIPDGRFDEFVVRGAVPRGLHRRQAASPSYREEPGVAEGLRSARRTWRSSSSSTTGAGPACRSTCARPRRCRKQGHRGGAGLQGGAACGSSASGSSRPRRAPNVLAIRIQPDEGVIAPLRRQGAGHRDGHSPRQHGVPLRHARSAPSRPRPTSGCCSTASWATRRSSPAPTRSRPRGGGSSRIHGELAEAPPRRRHLRGRHLGPGGGRAALAARRPRLEAAVSGPRAEQFTSAARGRRRRRGDRARARRALAPGVGSAGGDARLLLEPHRLRRQRGRLPVGPRGVGGAGREGAHPHRAARTTRQTSRASRSRPGSRRGASGRPAAASCSASRRSPSRPAARAASTCPRWCGRWWRATRPPL